MKEEQFWLSRCLQSCGKQLHQCTLSSCTIIPKQRQLIYILCCLIIFYQINTIFIKLFEIRGKFSCLFLSGLALAQAVMVKAFTVGFLNGGISMQWVGYSRKCQIYSKPVKCIQTTRGRNNCFARGILEEIFYECWLTFLTWAGPQRRLFSGE